MTEFEKLGGTYRQVGDYYLPNLEIDNQSRCKLVFGDSDTGDF